MGGWKTTLTTGARCSRVPSTFRVNVRVFTCRPRRERGRGNARGQDRGRESTARETKRSGRERSRARTSPNAERSGTKTQRLVWIETRRRRGPRALNAGAVVPASSDASELAASGALPLDDPSATRLSRHIPRRRGVASSRARPACRPRCAGPLDPRYPRSSASRDRKSPRNSSAQKSRRD